MLIRMSLVSLIHFLPKRKFIFYFLTENVPHRKNCISIFLPNSFFWMEQIPSRVHSLSARVLFDRFSPFHVRVELWSPAELFWPLLVGNIDDEESVFYTFWSMFSSADKTCSMNEEFNFLTSIISAISLRFCSTTSDSLFIWEACLFMKYQSLSQQKMEISSVNSW